MCIYIYIHIDVCITSYNWIERFVFIWVLRKISCVEKNIKHFYNYINNVVHSFALLVNEFKSSWQPVMRGAPQG